MKLTLSILAFALVASCLPKSYVVDTRPYIDAIDSNPEAVAVNPEHVTPVGGGFQGLETTVEIITDHGSISTDGKSVNVRIDPILVDARSGK